jgi:Uma2 family endonuclease
MLMNAVRLSTPPRTIMEVYKMLPEGTLAELINGTLYMSPSPTKKHQLSVRELAFAIHQFVKSNKLGEVYFAPYDVFLDEHLNVVQPDIIYIGNHKREIDKDDGIHGAPDLIVEVLSAGNSRHDKIIKKDLYEKFGVQEYWIVDPQTKEALGYTLKAGVYVEIGTFVDKIHSSLLQSEFIF